MNAVTQIPESAHDEFGPSGANTWVLCAGSAIAQRGMPDTDNEHSLRGTASHSVVEEVATGRLAELPPVGTVVPTALVDGGTVDIVLTEEDLTAINVCTDFVKEQNVGDCQFMAEHRTDPGLACQADGMRGTMDLRFYYPATKYLHVADYKHGRSPVEITNNLPLILYTIGEAAAVIRAGQLVETVRMTLIQPRRSDNKPAISSIELSITDLWDWVPYLSAARKAADQPDAPRTAGEAQCRWCKAVPICPEAGGTAISDVTQVQQSIESRDVHIPESPDLLTPGQLANAVGHFARLRSWMDKVEAHMLKLSLDGSMAFINSQGQTWGPVPVNSPRRWKFGQEDTMKKLSNRLKTANNYLDKGDKLTINVYRGYNLLSFTQVLNNVQASLLNDEEKGKLIDAITTDLVEKPTGKTKLGVMPVTAADIVQGTVTDQAPIGTPSEDMSFLD